MKISKVLFLCFFLAGISISKTDLTSTLGFDLTYQLPTLKDAPGFDSTNLKLNYNSDKKKPAGSTTLTPDITSNSISVGNDLKNDWGIDCYTSQNSSVNCLYADVPATQGTFRNVAMTYNLATTFLLLGDKIDTTDTPLKNLRLVQTPTQDKWPLTSSGALGLSPSNSDLYNYLFANYNFKNEKLNLTDGSFVFNLIYYLNDQDNKFSGGKNDTWTYSTLMLNGWDDSRRNKAKPTVNITQKAGSDFWTIPSASILVAGKDISIKGDACLNNNANTLFAFLPQARAAFAKAVNQAACSSDSCKYSDIKGTFNASLSFLDSTNTRININLHPDDFVFNSNDKLAVSVDSLENWQSPTSLQCSPTAAIGLGKLFFYRNLVYFKVWKNSDSSLSSAIFISDILPIDKITDIERWVLFGFGLLLILCIVGTVIFKYVKSKQVREGDYRQPIDA